MGRLTDFIIADVGSGVEVGESLNPADQWPTLQCKGADPINVAMLYCVITGKVYHYDILASFKVVGGDEEDGPWVFEIPLEVLQAIAGVSQSQIQGIAQQWVAAAELQRDGWSVGDAVGFIKEFSAHINRAFAESKALYLWLAL